MKRKKKAINTKKERVLLSDVLPFEIPVTFSNRHFYSFLVSNGIHFDKGKIKWDSNDSSLELIIKLIFGFKKDKTAENKMLDCRGHFKTIPFSYKISHKEKDFRDLRIIHPINQLALIEFYEHYKELILYYCNISPFSLRKPHKIARFSYFNDRTHIEMLAHDHEHKTVEEFDKEYENLKTFFSYKEISNVYKFYESYKYQRCEKKYNKLFKFDITRCFDSIYSHSIAWALLNKEIVKDKDLMPLSLKTFGGKFDRLMSDLNYGETHGIVIGPEFSRIFAELILQRIDFNVMYHLQEKNNLKFKTDYEIFRYVDDFFVFYNSDEAKDEILDAYRHQLMDYKLYINDAKSLLFEKPIITDITIAKLNISDLLKNSLKFKITDKDVKESDREDENFLEKKYSFYVSANKLITQFKLIIKEAGIAYKDILNYTLACIDRKTLKLIKIYGNIEDKKNYEKRVTKAVLELLDFTFFLYSVSPKVNTTVKLCLILSKLIKFAKLKENFNHDNKHRIFKEIYDGIHLVLWKNKHSEYTQVETLYLLIALRELGQKYRLSENVLCKYFDLNIDSKKSKTNLNHFSISVLLFYIGNKSRYSKIKVILKDIIKRKFKSINKANRLKMAESILLFFDLLACPYLDDDFKKELLTYYDIIESAEQNIILSRQGYWFTQWDDFDFGKELEAKKSQEVY